MQSYKLLGDARPLELILSMGLCIGCRVIESELQKSVCDPSRGLAFSLRCETSIADTWQSKLLYGQGELGGQW